ACGQRADKEAANETRRIGDGNDIDVVPGHLGLSERLINNRVYDLDMATRRDLWYDAAVSRMNVYLRINDVRNKRATVFYDGRRCFVAAAFYAQNVHWGKLYHKIWITLTAPTASPRWLCGSYLVHKKVDLCAMICNNMIGLLER